MRRVLVTAIIAVTVLAFGYFVWPTRWTYYHFAPLGIVRVERWNGRVEGFDRDCGWMNASVFADRVSADTYVNGCPARGGGVGYVDPFADLHLNDSIH